jgi:hypothetical protein
MLNILAVLLHYQFPLVPPLSSVFVPTIRDHFLAVTVVPPLSSVFVSPIRDHFLAVTVALSNRVFVVILRAEVDQLLSPRFYAFQGDPIFVANKALLYSEWLLAKRVLCSSFVSVLLQRNAHKV